MVQVVTANKENKTKAREREFQLIVQFPQEKNPVRFSLLGDE